MDDPDLPDGWQMFPDMTVPEYRRYAALRVEALNQALRGLPEAGPAAHLLGQPPRPAPRRHPAAGPCRPGAQRRGGCYSVEAANPRHEHEWAVWNEVELPDGKSLMPGVVGHASDIIEHPELVAQRLIRFAGLVGRENVIAGTDCGLGGRVGHPEIVWAKLADLAAGPGSPPSASGHNLSGLAPMIGGGHEGLVGPAVPLRRGRATPGASGAGAAGTPRGRATTGRVFGSICLKLCP